MPPSMGGKMHRHKALTVVSLLALLCPGCVTAGSGTVTAVSNPVKLSGYVSNVGSGAVLFPSADLDNVAGIERAEWVYNNCYDLTVPPKFRTKLQKYQGRKIEVSAIPHAFPAVTSGVNPDGSGWFLKYKIRGVSAPVPRCKNRNAVYFLLDFHPAEP